MPDKEMTIEDVIAGEIGGFVQGEYDESKLPSIDDLRPVRLSFNDESYSCVLRIVQALNYLIQDHKLNGECKRFGVGYNSRLPKPWKVKCTSCGKTVGYLKPYEGK